MREAKTPTMRRQVGKDHEWDFTIDYEWYQELDTKTYLRTIREDIPWVWEALWRGEVTTQQDGMTHCTRRRDKRVRKSSPTTSLSNREIST